MRTPLTYTKLHNHFLTPLFRRTVVANIHKDCPKKTGHALLYHKTTSLIPGYRHDYTHTNNWEITQQVKILNQLGFWVDVADRGVPNTFVPNDKYDIFLGIGLDGSGRHYTRLAKSLPSATKILYAVTSNPDVRNANLDQRYQNFQKRNQATLPVTRRIEGIDVTATMALTDYIFCVGNEVTQNTMHQYRKPIYKIDLSTAPFLQFDRHSITKKSPNHWLFLGGDGNILKGLDLLLEVFAELPKLHLHVCTTIEKAFLKHYQPLLERSPNIHLENFVIPSSPRFKQLTNICSFVILPSGSEGSATSVTTCMRRGLIPVATPQVGIDTSPFGFTIDDISIPALKRQIYTTANLNQQDIHQRIIQSRKQSFKFTQQAFTKSFTNAMLKVMNNERTLRKYL